MAELISSRYAGALFEVSLEIKKEEETYNELAEISEVFRSNMDFFKVMKTPTVSKEEKKNILVSVFESKVSSEVFNFMKILVDKGRFGSFLDICEAFKGLLNSHKNIMEVIAVTAVELTAQQKSNLEEKLSKSTGKTIELKNEIDTSVLGGVLIRMGNEEIDGTVKSRLDKLKEEVSQIIA